MDTDFLSEKYDGLGFVIYFGCKSLGACILLGCGLFTLYCGLYYVRLHRDILIGCKHACAGISNVAWFYLVYFMLDYSE